MIPGADVLTSPDLGAILGATLGLLGAALGTYRAIRHTGGARERGFAMRAAAALWLFLLAFLAALVALPAPYRHLLWIPYLALLLWGIRAWNGVQLALRREETGGG